MVKQPNVTLKIILRSKKKILIMRHKDGNYDFPGGRMEWGEELFSTLKRETKEELNFVLIDEPRLFHVWNYKSKDGKRQSIMIYFFQELAKPIKFVSPENIDIFWLAKNEMGKIIHHRDFIKRIYGWKNKKTTSNMNYPD